MEGEMYRSPPYLVDFEHRVMVTLVKPVKIYLEYYVDQGGGRQHGADERST